MKTNLSRVKSKVVEIRIKKEKSKTKVYLILIYIKAKTTKKVKFKLIFLIYNQINQKMTEIAAQ